MSKTMSEEYGEPNDELGSHEVCSDCGFCIDFCGGSLDDPVHGRHRICYLCVTGHPIIEIIIP